MGLTITIDPEMEARFRDEATRVGVSLEEFAYQRLLEAELLWRIRTATPEAETRLLHKLLRKQRNGKLTEIEQHQLQSLLDDREERGAQRLQDLGTLARLRSLSIKQVMEQLGIKPIQAP